MHLNDEKNQNHNSGKKIGEIVHSALQSGDFSRLKDLGPAVQEAVGNIPGVKLETRQGSPPAKRENASPARQNTAQTDGSVTPWAGSGQRKKPLRIPGGLVQTVLGAIGLLAFGLCSILFLGLSMVLPLEAIFIPLSISFGAVALASGGLLAAGQGTRQFGKRLAQYTALFQKKQVYTFDELAAETGRTPKQIKKDIRKARAKGLLPDMRTDADETCLMQGEETYQQYLATEKARLQRENAAEERQRRLGDPATADLERFRSEGEATIKKIRAANNAIPGEEISQKLSTLEDTTARIFTYVEQHPKKLPDTRKFMSYYLPTTLKLVEKYRQYEAMDYQPENVKQAKGDIERSLDTINKAFTNLLESLFDHDTLDVSTDIDVLEKMLEQEGLTGKRFEIDPSARP